MDVTSPSIMTRLKEETKPMHDDAESAALERDMMGGKLPKEVYVRNLEQRMAVHRALEAALRDVRPAHPVIAAVVGDYQFKEPFLEKDLLFFGRDPKNPDTVPATREMIAWVQDTAKKDPMALLGIQYVFEGSTNGARFLARAAKGAYRLEGPEGTAYLDPYGEQQRPLWAKFKETMDAQPLTPAQADAIVKAATETFRFVGKIDRELYPAVA
jgi:heme oxygenase